MKDTLQIIFGLFGGQAIFIYGMNMMSESLQKAAGEKSIGTSDKKPITGCTCGSPDNCCTAEQQRNYCYGDRICQCGTYESSSGNIHYIRSEYRNNYDGTDYCL